MQIQHVVPQRDYTHEIEVGYKGNPRKRVCKICGKRVAYFKDTEGPEGLKAYFPGF